MTKDVLVTITSRHDNYGEHNAIQSISPGTYCYIQGRHVVRYEEILEETIGSEPVATLCILKIGEDSVSLTKRGQADTEMYFKRGEAFDGIYDTPAGSLRMCLRTSRLDITEAEEAISVDLEYGLDLNYSHISDCYIKIDITPQKLKKKMDNSL